MFTKVDDVTFINKNEIVSVQDEEICGESWGISNSGPYLKFKGRRKGCRIIFSNGRKVFVEKMTADEFIEKLKEAESHE